MHNIRLQGLYIFLTIHTRVLQRSQDPQSAGSSTEFGKLILRKVIEIVATRCQILRLKCTKIDFGWGSAPDPTEELTALLQTP